VAPPASGADVPAHDPAEQRWLTAVRSAAAAREIDLVEGEIADGTTLERTVASAKRDGVDGVFLVSIELATNFTTPIIRLAREHRLPLAGMLGQWVEKATRPRRSA
jgi:hypothetical protein